MRGEELYFSRSILQMSETLPMQLLNDLLWGKEYQHLILLMRARKRTFAGLTSFTNE
jgi:hypothetical protein